MPTKNPRLSVTFQPSVMARLRRLSELTGNSQGALVAEFLQGSLPAIDRLIRLLEAAQGAKADVLGKLQADMEAAQSRVEAQLGLALSESDELTASLLEPAEAIKRRSARSATRERGSAGVAVPAATPPSNRGVRSTKNTARTES